MNNGRRRRRRRCIFPSVATGDTAVRDDRGSSRAYARWTHWRWKVFQPARARTNAVATEADGPRGKAQTRGD